MHHLNVVHQTHEHIGLQRLHLIEIERTEQTVSPAERGVGVDDQVRVIFDGMASIDDVFECRPAKRGQTRDGQIKNPTIPNTGASRTSSSRHGKSRCGLRLAPPSPRLGEGSRLCPYQFVRSQLLA